MASFELSAFQPTRDLSIVAAIESPASGIIQLGFWLNDPMQQIIWTDKVAGHPRLDFLWEHTCFELFIGIRDQDQYIEVNLSPSGAWQSYHFEEYRYPETMPPPLNSKIELVELKRTGFGLTATIDINLFLHHHKIAMKDLFVGISAVIQTTAKTHYFAMQHSSPEADFHNKRDWLHQF